jgi:hypothetical protein
MFNMIWSLSLGKFYGIDSLVEFLIIIVSLVISYYSHKVYKLLKDKNYKFFSLAFLFIAISFVFKILSNLTIVNKVIIEKANFVFVIFKEFQYMQLINFLSFIFYKTLNMIGFLFLFFIVTRTEKRENIFLYFYLSIIVIMFSIYDKFNFIFHLTLIFILFSLTIHFYDNHKKIRSKNTLLVFLAFLIILISHVFFSLIDVHPLTYLIGEILLLFGFLFLVINHIIIQRQTKRKSFKLEVKRKNELEKNKAGSYKRYSRNPSKK